MKSTSFKSNWSSKAIALLALVGVSTIAGHAQTVLIDDGFSGSYNGLGGSSPDTTDVPATQWVGAYNRGVSATWSPSGYAASDYSGNGSFGAGISFAGLGLNIDTLTVDGFKSTTGQSGNPIAFGFSTVTPTGSNVNGGYAGYVTDTGGLGVELYSGGNGSLVVSGSAVASWSSPLDFTAGAVNTLSISYNDLTDIATVTEAGDQVAQINVGSLSLTSAGIGGFYNEGWNNGDPNPDGFSSFEVTTEAVATPEPSSMALMFAGAMGLFFYRRFRTSSQS